MSVLMVERKCNKSPGEKRLKYIEHQLGDIHLRPLEQIPTSDMVHTNQKGE